MAEKVVKFEKNDGKNRYIILKKEEEILEIKKVSKKTLSLGEWWK